MVRWLYIRRPPRDAFNIDFGVNILRLYDEWDALVARVQQGKGKSGEEAVLRRCLETSAGKVHQSRHPVSFRLLSSAADMTNGNVEQILRIVATHLPDGPDPDMLRDTIEPRLACAIRWATTCLPEDERTRIRNEFDAVVFDGLSDEIRRGIKMLVGGLDECHTVDELTSLVYGVPKLLRGLPADTKPTPEIKQFQRSFFVAIYQLICGSDTGPRLPTLILSIGKERVRRLLGG